jgi:drug/metabolite transporter (DMT)-like permease
MLYELTAAAVVVSAFVPFQFVVPAAADLGWLAILAIACTVVPQIWIIYVLRSLSPFTVAVTVNLEPVYALILAAVLFHETLSVRFYVAAGVLFALVVVNGINRAGRGSAPP